jgi:hypothetical protein
MDRFIFLYRVSEWAISFKSCLEGLTNEPKKQHRRIVWEHYEPRFKAMLSECLTGSLAITESDLSQLFHELGQISQAITPNVDIENLRDLCRKAEGVISELLKIKAIEPCDEKEADFIM